MPNDDENEDQSEPRLVVSMADFRANPAEFSREALRREVEIVVNDDTRIYMARKIAPLD